MTQRTWKSRKSTAESTWHRLAQPGILPCVLLDHSWRERRRRHRARARGIDAQRGSTAVTASQPGCWTLWIDNNTRQGWAIHSAAGRRLGYRSVGELRQKAGPGREPSAVPRRGSSEGRDKMRRRRGPGKEGCPWERRDTNYWSPGSFRVDEPSRPLPTHAKSTRIPRSLIKLPALDAFRVGPCPGATGDECES